MQRPALAGCVAVATGLIVVCLSQSAASAVVAILGCFFAGTIMEKAANDG
jgi:hypothetical protein